MKSYRLHNPAAHYFGRPTRTVSILMTRSDAYAAMNKVNDVPDGTILTVKHRDGNVVFTRIVKARNV
jgi:hypothetical protein